MKLITNLAGALHIHQMNLACKKRAIEDTLTHSLFKLERVRKQQIPGAQLFAFWKPVDEWHW
jgi:hypothetical protein